MSAGAAASVSVTRRLLHWASAVLILVLIPVGLRMSDAPLSDAAAIDSVRWQYSLHKTLGVIVAALTLWRLGLVAAGRGFRPSVHGPAETVAAAAVQSYFLLALLALPASGLVMHCFAGGAAPIWLWPGLCPALTPRPALVETAAALHGALANGLMIALLLHIMGALKHHFVDRDDTLRRMLSGARSSPPETDAARASLRRRGHRLGALLLCALAAAGIGWRWLGGAESALSDSAGGGWISAPEQSRLSIRAAQGGETIEAGFDRFTVALSGNAERPQAIDVDIDSASFASGFGDLDGAVRGADWLDAEAFPIARYHTDAIEADGEGYRAQGKLRIREVETPVPIRFTLQPEDHGLRLRGGARFDRFEAELGRGDFAGEDMAGRHIDVEFDVLLLQR